MAHLIENKLLPNFQIWKDFHNFYFFCVCFFTWLGLDVFKRYIQPKICEGIILFFLIKIKKPQMGMKIWKRSSMIVLWGWIFFFFFGGLLITFRFTWKLDYFSLLGFWFERQKWQFSLLFYIYTDKTNTLFFTVVFLFCFVKQFKKKLFGFCMYILLCFSCNCSPPFIFQVFF